MYCARVWPGGMCPPAWWAARGVSPGQIALLALEGQQSSRVVLAQERADLVGDLLPSPDGVLLGSSQDGNDLGEFGVGRQGSVGVHVGTQDVRQDQGVAWVGFFAADAVAVAVASGHEGVDREDTAAAGAQGRHQEAVAGLDGHRYRGFGAVAVCGEEGQEFVVAGRVVGDTGFGEQSAGFVDEGDVVVALCPVDAAEHGQAVLQDLSVYAGHERMRVARRPIPRTRWSAISVAVRDTSALQGLDLLQSSWARG